VTKLKWIKTSGKRFLTKKNCGDRKKRKLFRKPENRINQENDK
jgi:hypothetical protein